MKKTDIWMPIFIGDYLADTMHLTTKEHGAYLLLLLAYWRRGAPLEDSSRSLAASTRTSAEEWAEMEGVIRGFFRADTIEGVRVLRHKRVDAEMKKSNDIKSERSKAGKAGVDKRWRDSKPIANAIANELQTDSKHHSKNIAHHHYSSKLKTPASPEPSDIDSFAEAVYAAYPRKVGKPNALKAIRRALIGISGEALLTSTRLFQEARRGQEEAFTPHPATWFHQKRYLDDPKTWRGAEIAPKNSQAAGLAAALSVHPANPSFIRHQPDCPPEVLADYKAKKARLAELRAQEGALL